MQRGRWKEHYYDVFDEHLHAFCDMYDFDCDMRDQGSFEKLCAKIGENRGNVLYDIVFTDFLTRETEDGNIIDQYLKRRGWREKAISKAYIKSVRYSVLSLYEVSDIRPGESFLARDLILGGDPILVEERSGTKSMHQWEQFAMRILEVRGHNILAGGVFPFKPELADRIIDEINDRLGDVGSEFDEIFNGQDKLIGPEFIQDMVLSMALTMSAPMFSKAWLTEIDLDPPDRVIPTLANTDGDLVEFVTMYYSLAKGATQNQLRELLNDAPDMDAASSEFWNWVAPPDDGPMPEPNSASDKIYQVCMDNGDVVLGTIELVGEKLEAHVNSPERAKKAQERLKDILGDLVSEPLLTHKTVEQLIEEGRDKPAPEKQREPPTEAEIQVVKDFLDRSYRDALDRPVPVLDGESPRASVKTPEGKEKVVRWLKNLETEAARAQRSNPGGPYDFTWMWKELRIAELRK